MQSVRVAIKLPTRNIIYIAPLYIITPPPVTTAQYWPPTGMVKPDDRMWEVVFFNFDIDTVMNTSLAEKVAFYSLLLTDHWSPSRAFSNFKNLGPLLYQWASVWLAKILPCVDENWGTLEYCRYCDHASSAAQWTNVPVVTQHLPLQSRDISTQHRGYRRLVYGCWLLIESSFMGLEFYQLWNPRERGARGGLYFVRCWS